MRSSDLTYRTRARMIYANILQQQQQVLEKDQLRVNYQGGGTDVTLTSVLVEGPLYTSFAEQQAIIANAATLPTPQATPSAELPMVTTDSASGRSGVPGVSATGSVSGSSPLLQRGFVWNTTGAPTLTDTVYTDSATTFGQFTTNLATGYGTFYVAAYATSGAGTVYGDSVTVFTQPPTATTNSATGSADGTVTASATVTAQGSSAITDRGFVWATSGTPTLADSVSHASAAGTGSYINTIATGYGTFYVAAYATNAAGTTYGSTVSAQAIEPRAPSLTTTSATDNADGTATVSATISSAGTASITARGFVWGLTSPPTDTVVTVAGVSIGSYSTTIATSSGTFYVAAYATNSVGTTYGDPIEVTVTFPLAPSLTTTSATDNADGTAAAVGTVTSQGTAAVTARGFVWTTSAISSPTLADSSLAHESGGTGEYTDALTTGAGTFYVAAYATNSVGTTYGDPIQVTVTVPLAPSLTTTSATDNADGTATAVGTVTSQGTATVTARGFVWAATSPPTLADSSLAHESGGTGEYTDALTTGAGTFYVAAYATNSVGTTYGSPIEVAVTG